jgi:CheY-like chemotaxis protein
MAAILVVDDYPDSCDVLTRMIRQFKGPADCVESGADALRYCESHEVKLVFLDWMMPEMTGLEVLQRLRANPRYTKLSIVMFSAFSDPDRRHEALEAGAQGFIAKGHFDEVRAAITKYVV